ncbi:MAG: hypothetical protein LBG86_02185 [Puniceicoccales bacterium]|jgi:hypothetical protein|nr:hypothetical protein [Puniceicoccales bacterium]
MMATDQDEKLSRLLKVKRYECRDDTFWEEFDRTFAQKSSKLRTPQRERLGIIVGKLFFRPGTAVAMVTCFLLSFLYPRGGTLPMDSLSLGGNSRGEFAAFAFACEDNGEDFFENECCESSQKVFYVCEADTISSHGPFLTALEF